MKKLLILFLSAISLSAVAQIEENQFTIDGTTYDIEGDKMVKLDKNKGVWSLTGISLINGISAALDFRTSEEKLKTGTYDLCVNEKKIEPGKVGFSVTIFNQKGGALAVLKTKIYSSLENGKATVVNENGIYSITVTGVQTANLKKDNAVLTGNVTLADSDGKSRKALTAENKLLNKLNAWNKEVVFNERNYYKLLRAFKIFEIETTKDRRERIEDLLKILIESNEECMAILNREKDSSFPEDKIEQYKNSVTEAMAFFKSIKGDIKASKAKETRVLIEEKLKTWLF